MPLRFCPKKKKRQRRPRRKPQTRKDRRRDTVGWVGAAHGRGVMQNDTDLLTTTLTTVRYMEVSHRACKRFEKWGQRDIMLLSDGSTRKVTLSIDLFGMTGTEKKNFLRKFEKDWLELKPKLDVIIFGCTEAYHFYNLINVTRIFFRD